MRFDLRLPFADQGWVEESAASKGRRSSRMGTGSTEDKKRAAAAKKAAQARKRGAAPVEVDALPADASIFAKMAFQASQWGRKK